MKKCGNKGYMLTETLIVITLVATVITAVYGLMMNYYIKQENEVTKFNTADGLYLIKQIEKYLSGKESEYISELKTSAKSNDILDITDKNAILSQKLGIKKLYFTKYDYESITSSGNFIKTYKKEDGTEDEKGERILPIRIDKNLSTQTEENINCQYRYLVIFEDYSYSTIGIMCGD